MVDKDIALTWRTRNDQKNEQTRKDRKNALKKDCVSQGRRNGNYRPLKKK